MTDENPDRNVGPNWLTVDQLDQENMAHRHRHGNVWRLSEPDAGNLELSDWLWICGIVVACAVVVWLIVAWVRL